MTSALEIGSMATTLDQTQIDNDKWPTLGKLDTYPCLYLYECKKKTDTVCPIGNMSTLARPRTAVVALRDTILTSHLELRVYYYLKLSEQLQPNALGIRLGTQATTTSACCKMSSNSKFVPRSSGVQGTKPSREARRQRISTLLR